jgi:GT2 family glycosyltransferase
MGTTASVVVCAYSGDRWDQMIAAISSVQSQTVPPTEILLVIDHNLDLLRRAVAAFPDVRVMPNLGVRGLSDARNTGVGAATGDVVAFLDDDATAAPDWLDRLTAPYDDPDVIAVGGRSIPDWEHGKPGWFPEELNWAVGCTYTGHRTTPGTIRNPTGGNMSLRRDVCEAAGGFRPQLGRVGRRPLGGEETELSIRAARTVPGGKVWYDPEAVIHHLVPASRTTWKYLRSRCAAEGYSKALISGLVGAGDALATERSYALEVLPRGVLRGLGDALKGDIAGLGRAAAIVVGLASTVFGYLRGRIASRLRRNRGPEPGFEPTQVVHVELNAPLPSLDGRKRGAVGRYRRALVYARWNGVPIGSVWVDIPEEGVAPGALADAIWTELGAPLRLHGREFGFGEPERLGAAGFPSRRSSIEDPPVPHATVIIATRDRPDLLQRCLRSVLRLDYPHFDVVVVDSAPSDDASARLVAERFPEVHYVLESEPGLARAHNRGIEVAAGSILAFTDDDVVVDDQWLRRLATPFEDPEVACVTGMIVPMTLDTKAQWWLEGYAGFSKGSRRRTFDLEENRPDDALYPYGAGLFGSGANMAFRADVLKAGGGFDPALGAGSLAYGGDDLAAFFAVVAGGHRLVYEPAAMVHHHYRGDEASLSRQVFGYGAGLTAYLTKTLFDRPARVVELIRRAPRGVVYALSPRSPKNSRQADDFPGALRRRELLGMLIGPFAYVRSRWAIRHSGGD